jgi:hypothetical protein
MRKSSSVGLGELIDNGLAQETAFSPQGQLCSARPTGEKLLPLSLCPATPGTKRTGTHVLAPAHFVVSFALPGG